MDCPACGGFNNIWECFLGKLGRLSHFRCRHCGWEWSAEVPDEFIPDEWYDGEPRP